ncbi:MAG: mechanosensitive ion channel [Bacteroidales bacterium]|nr:mechanosensitive ion channel [Bacteroidales bacterium]
MRVCSVLMILTIVLSLNSTIKHLTNLYWQKNSIHKPIKGGIQVIQFVIFTVGAIISIAILLDKSPGKLLAGLGASTAVLMLIFKDSILGFVAGIQLSINDMVRIGDWVEIPDGSANGIVEDITLNTVKIRNWDNTISTIPPYNLISNPFKNWRGMEESGGRQVDKKIKIDSHTIKYCDEEFINKIKNSIPLMSHTEYDKEIQITNTKLFRDYIEKYLEHHPMVNNQLDIIITTSQQNEYGLTTRIYFFIKEKSWKKYEMIQSEIIDNILASATIFELNIFQRD